jgi:nitrite reductase/ring-hydroxylating ferredoxin subunit
MNTKHFHRLESLANLHDGYRQVFHLQGNDLLLLQHEGRQYVLDNICPHAGYPLHEGQILDGALRCPMHGYLFRLQNGECTYHPEGPCRDLRAHPVVTRGLDLGVLL